MATNDDLDDFFKKKDRKGHKPKKQAAILTNNEELLKQLVIVTSATSAFKENMDFDDDDEDVATANQNRHHFTAELNGINENHDINHTVINKSQPISNKTKTTAKLSVQDSNNNINEQQTGGNQQDEWEEFEDPNSKYDKLRLKFARAGNDQNNGDEDEDNGDYFDDGHHHDGNTDENINNIDGGGGDDDRSSRNARRREQLKEKPVWKLDQVKQSESVPTNDITDSPTEKVEEISKPTAATTSSAYRPPALRGGNNASVTVVSGVNQRTSKKEKPNLASVEDFPTLGAAVNKK
ncbi:unnamed protein product [Adineta steineri]|uniref:Uncharacterized protein n=1 Tax=Adineta steineri TaxID=433720 RepID=A0A815DF61_9BILA|nr:unnamed protein product [Adineta steineri]CAF3829997.1 unnamed protein product [Adineta steineri]